MKRTKLALLFGAAFLFLAPLASRPLWDSDEGRYAEIAREMLELRDWVSPHLNYVLYFEKPPLMYWLTAISLKLFGDNAFAARLWCAIFAWLTIWLLTVMGRQWRNERTGILAGAVAATSLGFFVFSQFLVLDMALTFWTTWILWCGARLLVENDPARLNRYARLLAVGVGGGIMTKGPVAIVLPGAAFIAAALWTRRWRGLLNVSWAPPALIAALITVPWFFAVSRRHPFFLYFFFVHEHVARFFTNVHHREAPVYFFIPVLIGGFLPWSAFIPGAMRHWFGAKAYALRRDPTAALLMVWSIGVFIFFSLSHSKLVPYILPIFPSLALLVAERFDAVWEAKSNPAWLNGGLIGLSALFIAVLVFLKWPGAPRAMADPAAQALLQRAGVLYLALCVAVFMLVGVRGMGRPIAAWKGLLASELVLLLAIAIAVPALDPYFSTKRLAGVINERALPSQKVVGYGISYENVLQTLVFYTQRRIAVYGDAGELTLGRDHAPDAAEWFAPADQARAAVARLPMGSWIVTDNERWNALSKSDGGEAFALIDKEGKLRLVQKQA